MAKENRLQEIKKAILYLKRKERIQNNNDVSVALNISASYLSQMLHGNKPFTDSFYEKFETHYNINLSDPFSYTDLDWVTDTPNALVPAPESNKQLFSSMKKLLVLKDKETENQKRIIHAQQQLIANLQKEIEVLKPLLN